MRSLVGPFMEDLPEHVMVDILSRLPVKTIIHCKFVCNKWRNLLSDSYFVNLHLLRSPAGLMIHHDSETEMNGYSNPGILKWVEVEDELDHHRFHHDPVMSFDLELAPIFQDTQTHLVGSVNGLICLWEFGLKSDNTYICNPITREYMILPTQRYNTEVYKTTVYGFGVGLLTQQYKVIQIFRMDGLPDSTLISQPEVYTVGTGQWRSLSHVPYRLNGACGIFLNGHAHWTVVDHDFPEKICAFDFDKETFELFPSPPAETIEESKINFQNLGVIKGCLCRCDAYDSEFVIWVMKEYGIKKSWCKEVVIKESSSPNLDWLTRNPVYLIECLKDGNILMVSYEDKLLVYCPRNKTIVDTEMFDRYLNGLAYRPSFLKLQNFESARVHVF